MRGACRAPENGCTVRGPFPSESQVCTPGGFGFLPLEPPSPRFSWKLYQAGTGPLSRPLPLRENFSGHGTERFFHFLQEERFEKVDLCEEILQTSKLVKELPASLGYSG